MSDDFHAELRKLAEKSRDRDIERTGTRDSQGGGGHGLIAVLGEFLQISQEGARIYNDLVKEERLTVYELSADFLEIFLSIPGRRGGLSIVSPDRIAVFFDEDPDIVTVIGKYRNNNSRVQVNTNKSLQLIKISCLKTEKDYEYKDNTGKTLDSKGVIALIMGWLVSG